jgi:uncharacterized membrane protein
MSNVTSPYRRLATIILWIMIICLAAHFLHDLQPSHLDLQGLEPASQVCHMAIHIGALGGIIPGIAFIVLICVMIAIPSLIQHSGARSVLLPPPILA